MNLVAGIETGGTKILARIVELGSGKTVAERRWSTGTADEAARDLAHFLSELPGGGRLLSVGMAAFGPLIVDPQSPDYGQMLATPKPGWAGSNLRAELEARLAVPVVVDTDVNVAALAEQLGAGQGLPSIAYVTVGTGIGAGLASDGYGLKGALHPEAGHLRLVRRSGDDMPSSCPFHDDCAEGLAAGAAVRRRLGPDRGLVDDPEVMELVADYLGQLAAALVLAWSPHRIVWGGGVIGAAPLIPMIEARLLASLGGYGVGPQVEQPGFCAPAVHTDAGLEGALLMAGRVAAATS